MSFETFKPCVLSNRVVARQLTEKLREIGCPRRISIETFKNPNFELLADLLDWLTHRYDPQCKIPDSITTEAERAEFVKSIVHFYGTRARLLLDPRKLYSADVLAVQEMHKIATILCESLDSYDASLSEAKGESEVVDIGLDPTELSIKLRGLRNGKAHCLQVVDIGASLYAELGNYFNAVSTTAWTKSLRLLNGLSENLSSTSDYELIEKSIQRIIESTKQTSRQLNLTCEELSKDLLKLEAQGKKKKQEVERAEKRLQSLQSVRPTFMKEYDRHEAELAAYYKSYLETHRNLDYLEHLLDEINRFEQKQLRLNQTRLKKVQKKLREEEWRVLRGEHDVNQPLQLRYQSNSEDRACTESISKAGLSADMLSGSAQSGAVASFAPSYNLYDTILKQGSFTYNEIYDGGEDSEDKSDADIESDIDVHQDHGDVAYCGAEDLDNDGDDDVDNDKNDNVGNHEDDGANDDADDDTDDDADDDTDDDKETHHFRAAKHHSVPSDDD